MISTGSVEASESSDKATVIARQCSQRWLPAAACPFARQASAPGSANRCRPPASPLRPGRAWPATLFMATTLSPAGGARGRRRDGCGRLRQSGRGAAARGRTLRQTAAGIGDIGDSRSNGIEGARRIVAGRIEHVIRRRAVMARRRQRLRMGLLHPFGGRGHRGQRIAVEGVRSVDCVRRRGGDDGLRRCGDRLRQRHQRTGLLAGATIATGLAAAGASLTTGLGKGAGARLATVVAAAGAGSGCGLGIGAASTAASSSRVNRPRGLRPALASKALMAVMVRRPKRPSAVPSNRASAASFFCSASTSSLPMAPAAGALPRLPVVSLSMACDSCCARGPGRRDHRLDHGRHGGLDRGEEQRCRMPAVWK